MTPHLHQGMPRDGENQRLAFAYLRERARDAHRDGDGLRVNHLCAVALSELKSLTKNQSLRTPLEELAWCMILPLYWLIDGYMLETVETAIDEFTPQGGKEKEWLRHIEAYQWLVAQPLGGVGEFESTFRQGELNWLNESGEPELHVLLCHSVELLWYRGPTSSLWTDVVDRWAKIAKALSEDLTALSSRLREQANLTVFGARIPLPPSTLASPPSWQWLREIWDRVLDCDWGAVDAIALQRSARSSLDAPVARYLFDIRHFMRLRGKWGDDQAVGLTRRRLTISSFPTLVFEELRAAHNHILVGDLFRGGKKSGAHERVHAFRIAMLREMDALRQWDLFAWFAAIRAQATSDFEAFSHDVSRTPLAIQGIKNSVAGLAYERGDRFVAKAIRGVDFAPEDERMGLVRDLLSARPLHAYHVLQVLDDLGDAIPEKLFPELADWSLRYVELEGTKKLSGSKAFPLEFWAQLFPFVPHASEVWRKLFPQVLSDANNPVSWDISDGYLEQFLRHAPREFAIQLARQIIDHPQAKSGNSGTRWNVLLSTVEDRPDIRDELLDTVAKCAPSEGERIVLRNLAPDRPDLWGDEDMAREAVIKRLLALADKALWTGSNAERPTYQGRGIFAVSWRDSDSDVVEKLANSLRNPKTINAYCHAFLFYLRGIVENGKQSLAEKLKPDVSNWLREPPTGHNPMERENVPFSAFNVFFEFTDSIFTELTRLAQAIWNRTNGSNRDDAEQWVLKQATDLPPATGWALVAFALPLAHQASGFRQAELVAASRAVLQILWTRMAHEPALSSHLAKALHAYRWFFRSGYFFNGVHVQSSPEFDEIILRSLEPILSAASLTPQANIRQAVASLLALAARKQALPPALSDVFERLKNDARARVRYACAPKE